MYPNNCSIESTIVVRFYLHMTYIEEKQAITFRKNDRNSGTSIKPNLTTW